MTAGDAHSRQAVLVQLGAAPDVERAVRLVEEAGGRVLHAYPPHALIAELPRGAGEQLVGQAGITAVSSEPVPVTRAPGPLAAVIDAWNAHLLSLRPPTRSGSGLAWDTPGLQPPDPPPDVMRQLRRRERELNDPSESDPEDSGHGS